MQDSTTSPYQAKHHIRIVTAASLFDGHDAAINIMRRIIQSSGAEVIHLGHNRSVAEIVRCAVEEDAQAIAATSYQGGHVEYFKYMHDLLRERGADIKIFGGGGGTILPDEAAELHAYGITRIYSPDDGRSMGLQGMIDDLMRRSDFPTAEPPIAPWLARLEAKDHLALAKLITIAENHPEAFAEVRPEVHRRFAGRTIPVLGITGTGGSGKSSLVDELVRRFLLDFPERTVAIVSVDPSKRKTGGALLGDRIRMNAIENDRVFMRSLATRQSNLALSRHVQDAIDLCKAAGFDLVMVETSGIGQSDTEITDHSDVALYVMTADYGAATQLEKIDMLDFADLIAINKFDHRGALDALRDVRKQYRRNHKLFDARDEELPIYGTIASQFNDPGTNTLYRKLTALVEAKTGAGFASTLSLPTERTDSSSVIPPGRVRYLAEIVESSEAYGRKLEEQAEIARRLYQLAGTIDMLRANIGKPTLEILEEGCQDVVRVIQTITEEPPYLQDLVRGYQELEERLDPEWRRRLGDWPAMVKRYRASHYSFQVRDKVIEQDLYHESLSHTKVAKVALPRYRDWGDLLLWLGQESPPGHFPFTAGVFPLKRVGEDPARMFAGEGGPEKTNLRFHLLAGGIGVSRLSTAFDSVTLYGNDPDHRPDIYGKIGNSGVSVASLDDAKKLYSGFDLADPKTSVSMTINGPAPMMLGFFMNAAIDQQCERHIKSAGLSDEVERKIAEIYSAKGAQRPGYRGE
ncbi:MAG: methylmalonyl-CoA mutase family protein, partial [Polyangia bacterium]|nr:methylmalonyl-CoA mutase family protein [Polyangia bacterium]